VVAGGENLIAVAHALQLCAERFGASGLLPMGQGSGQEEKRAAEKRQAGSLPARNGNLHSSFRYLSKTILARSASVVRVKMVRAENPQPGDIRASLKLFPHILGHSPVDQKDI
jgi:hypothetical protein